jgi:hypothetical protein
MSAKRGLSGFSDPPLLRTAAVLRDIVQQIGDQRGPAGLVRGADAQARVAVEVFVE